METIETIFGYLTLVSALIMTSIGLPSQIWRNYKTKTSGLALILLIITLAVYVSRVTYTSIRQDYFILIPDCIGLICSIVLCVQHFRYKNSSL
jgi:hypothetical protein